MAKLLPTEADQWLPTGLPTVRDSSLISVRPVFPYNTTNANFASMTTEDKSTHLLVSPNLGVFL